MSSHARTNRFYKSKNPRGRDEDSSGVNLTLRNPSKPQSSKTLSAPAKQSRKPLPSSDRDELHEFTLQRTPMKLSVQPENNTDEKYENEADDDFCASPQQPSQPTHYGLEENPHDEDKDASTSDYRSDPKPSRRPTSLEEKQIDLEMLKEKNQNLELWHAMKHGRTFSGPEESSISTRFRSIKRPKKDKIYCSTDYANFRSFCHQIKNGSKGLTTNERYKEAKRLLTIEEVDSWNHYRIEKNASEDWVVLKDFLDRLLGDRTHWVNISWLDWVEAKKASNESDNTFLRQFNTLKTQIGDEANNPANIEVMLFFAGLDEPMQQKICK